MRKRLVNVCSFVLFRFFKWVFYYRMAGFPGIKVSGWGDSHFCKHRHFPVSFCPYLTAPKFVSVFYNHSYGGRKFDENFQNQFKAHLFAENNYPSVELIFLGGNNIRSKYRNGGGSHANKATRVQEEIQAMLKGYENILTFAAQFPKVKIGLVSPLPSKNAEHEQFLKSFLLASNTLLICTLQMQSSLMLGTFFSTLCRKVLTPLGKT